MPILILFEAGFGFAVTSYTPLVVGASWSADRDAIHLVQDSDTPPLPLYLKGSCFAPPAALVPCLGALALVGGRGRPLCVLPLFFPCFSPRFLVRVYTGCRSRRATEPPVGGLAQASIAIQSSTSDFWISTLYHRTKRLQSCAYSAKGFWDFSESIRATSLAW